MGREAQGRLVVRGRYGLALRTGSVGQLGAEVTYSLIKSTYSALNTYCVL